MTNAPKVSIVIPYHNEGQLLVDALQSVLGQTYLGEMEIIVVDDGSRIPPPIPATTSLPLRVVRNETACYAGAARNKGLQLASGKYVTFLDADDTYYPTRIQDHVDFLESHPQVVMVGGRTLVHREAKSEYSSNFVDTFFSQYKNTAAVLPDSARHYCCGDYMFCTGSFTTTRERLLDTKGFDESLRWGEEWDLQVRLAQLGPIATLPQLALDYRCREGSVCSTLNPEKFRTGAQMYARWRRTITVLPATIIKELKRREHEQYLLAAQVFLENSNAPDLALSCAIASWRSGCTVWSFRSTIRTWMYKAKLLPLAKLQPQTR
jgi:GT2 family glycosyltransferase